MFNGFELLDCLTPKRLELFNTVSTFNVSSIRELAELLGRDVKNVWEDLKVFEEFGLIGFKKVGRVKRPVVKKQIIITVVEVN